MGDYIRHWIKMQRGLEVTPRVFHVNWFRRDAEGKFLWPGFSQNMRVLRWIVDRVQGRTHGRETPIGWVPRYDDIDWSGLEFPREAPDPAPEILSAAPGDALSVNTAGTSSTVNFNGMNLIAGASSTTWIANITTANVQAGGMKVNSNGFDVTIPQVLSHDGGLGATPDGGFAKSGSGSVTRSVGASPASPPAYSGPTNFAPSQRKM